MLYTISFFMRFILDAVFEDLDTNLISVVLQHILAFAVFGFIFIGLPYSFHPERTITVLKAIQTQVFEVFETPAAVEPVELEPAAPRPPPRDVRSAVLRRSDDSQEGRRASSIYRPITTQPLQAAPAATQPRQATPALDYSRRSTVVDRQIRAPYSVMSRDYSSCYSSNATPYHPREPLQRTDSRESRGNMAASPPLTRPDLTVADLQRVPQPGLFSPAPTLPSSNVLPSAVHTQAPSNTQAQVQIAVPDFLLPVLNHLHSNVTYPLALDANGAYLPRDLPAAEMFWNVTDDTTGLTIGVINKAGHLGQSILLLATLYAQASQQMRTYSIFD
ncbi:hypothetical protein FRB98_003731, partial [Tulasnella sp. 332]